MTEEKSDILVVLDIDETLVYATENKLEIVHDLQVGDYFVYKRPYLDEFIEYIDKNFPFAVWSSATDTYVLEVTNKLGLREKALFCWARSKATYKRPATFNSDGDLNVHSFDHHFFVKRLKKVKSFGFSLDKNLIIDDTPRKSQENYGNAIYVSEFKGNQADNELIKLTEYLNTLKQADNVRVIEKRGWKKD